MRKLCTVAICGILLFVASACGKATATDSKVSTPDVVESIVLPVREYAKAIDEDTTAVLIDVRTPEEYAQGHIDGARLMNVSEEETFASAVDSLPTTYTYYIYCRSGRRSQKAAGIMRERGLKVVDLQGGYNAWQEEKKGKK